MNRGRERHRLFFALWPDTATRERLQAASGALLAEMRPGGRRVARERLHMTLHFLGTYAQHPQDPVTRALAAGSDVRAGPFTLQIDVSGSFGQRIWWLAPRNCPQALMQLRERLEHALSAHDAPQPEAGRPWKPHVTVLRGGNRQAPERDVTAVPWPVRDFVLVHSSPDTGGAYAVLRRFPLRGD